MKRSVSLFLVLSLLLLSGCEREGVPVVPSPTLPSAEVPTEEPREIVSGEAPSEAPTEEAAPTESDPAPAEPEDDAFVRIIDYIPTVRQALAYATANNFTGNRIYDFTDAYLRYGTVKKLKNAADILAAQGIGLIVWDGFRPVEAQARLWEVCPDPTFVSNPVTGRRTHCRGNTVDVALYDLETGAELPVPTGFDNFTAYADRDYSDCSPEAAANARLLEQTMESCGFTAYFSEWWHFADRVDYPVDEYFNPAVPPVWSANCDEYISLRESPGGAVLTRITRGETVSLQSWTEKYARVRYENREGYVLTSYIMPENDDYFMECLDTVIPTAVYSYQQMCQDLQALQDRYPEVVSLSSIGTSELGRDIPVLRMGNPSARYHVLLQGSIHGREHLTAWLLTAMADYWLDHGLLGYGDICWHIIPMSNPDGVILSQTMTLDASQQEIYARDLAAGYASGDPAAYAADWKANGLGVDINRNFPAGWDAIRTRSGPSCRQYRGPTPFSSRESAALRDYTLKYAFDATISYHATGSVIYWEYGTDTSVNTASKALAKAVREVTGYSLADSGSVEGGGYKDWVMEELGIPSLTIEVGCGEAALAYREIYSIFVRNYRVLSAIARHLQQ